MDFSAVIVCRCVRAMFVFVRLYLVKNKLANFKKRLANDLKMC